MTPEQYDAFIDHSAAAVRQMLGDLRERVKEASAAVIEETQAEGGKAIVPISIKLKLDLSSMAVEPSASVSFRRVIAGDRFEIGDPNQPELNLEDEK